MDILNKKELRTEIRRRKQLCSEEELLRCSEDICHTVENHPLWQQSQTILLYHSLPDEVLTTGLLERWCESKRLILPVVEGDHLLLRPFQAQVSMNKNQWGILEPEQQDTTQDIAASEIELALIPGMAFDRQGHRLGRGKGFYDRLLPQLNCPTLGLCFPFQLLEHIPCDSWDMPVNQVIYK